MHWGPESCEAAFELSDSGPVIWLCTEFLLRQIDGVFATKLRVALPGERNVSLAMSSGLHILREFAKCGSLPREPWRCSIMVNANLAASVWGSDPAV